MNLSNFDNHLKTSAFKKFKRILHKYYLRFSRISQNSAHLNQFLVLLNDCVPKLKHF